MTQSDKLRPMMTMIVHELGFGSEKEQKVAADFFRSIFLHQKEIVHHHQKRIINNSHDIIASESKLNNTWRISKLSADTNIHINIGWFVKMKNSNWSTPEAFTHSAENSSMSTMIYYLRLDTKCENWINNILKMVDSKCNIHPN